LGDFVLGGHAGVVDAQQLQSSSGPGKARPLSAPPPSPPSLPAAHAGGALWRREAERAGARAEQVRAG
jgi:hypothetical protein